MSEMHAECARKFAALETRTARLEDDNERRGKSLQDIYRKLEHLGWALAVILGGVVVQLGLTLLRGAAK